jgi:hypothetical protein
MAEMVTAMSPCSTTGATGMSTCCCAPAGSCRMEITVLICFTKTSYMNTEYIKHVKQGKKYKI